MALRESEQNEFTAKVLEDYCDAGFTLYATEETIDFIRNSGMDVNAIDYETAQEWITNHDADSNEKISLVINVPTVANRKEIDSFPVRRKAIERGISVMTCMDTAWAMLKAIKLKQAGVQLDYELLD